MIKLSFDIFGRRIAGITLDFVLPEPESVLDAVADTVVTKGVKRLSQWWLKGMVR
jgi:hypothetical protein